MPLECHVCQRNLYISVGKLRATYLKYTGYHFCQYQCFLTHNNDLEDYYSKKKRPCCQKL